MDCSHDLLCCHARYLPVHLCHIPTANTIYWHFYLIDLHMESVVECNCKYWFENMTNALILGNNVSHSSVQRTIFPVYYIGSLGIQCKNFSHSRFHFQAIAPQNCAVGRFDADQQILTDCNYVILYWILWCTVFSSKSCWIDFVKSLFLRKDSSHWTVIFF